ncbi:MAG TPA: TonB family protein [Cyclobacteriaceae bacterium]|nr:TonB family protein [Cyclobacteriaceae bacterium]
MADLKADIEKYLSGKLSPAEMHALEKKALDDPFLAAALEGGALLPPDEFTADVAQLQKSINEKVTRRKSTQLVWWQWPLRIAAGLLLLGASTYIVLNLVSEEKGTTEPIALNKPADENQILNAPDKSDSLPVEKSLSIDESSHPSVARKGEQEGKQATESKQETNVASAEKKSDDFAALDNDARTTDDQSVEATEDEEPVLVSPSLAEQSKDETPARAKSRAAQTESRRELRDVAASSPSGAIVPSELKIDSKLIKGKVTDIDDGLPLPGVNVLVEGTKIGTVTDLNGNYEINVPENQNLIFSYIGMESKAVAMENKSDSPLDVQLAPDVSELSEVVVTGYGTGDEPSMEDIKWEITEPKGGKKAYRNYLEQNLHYPALAIQNNTEGKVTVQFTVEPNGQLTDFRVVKSLGSGCDDEVIRLIKEGPKWSPTRRNDEPVKSKAKVKMRFALPGKKK